MFVLEHAIRKVEAKQERLKLNGTHPLLVCANDANLLDGNINTYKNTEALLIASKKIGLEVNGGKTKEYVYVSWKECRRESQHKDTYGNKSFEIWATLKYLGKILTKSKLNSWRNKEQTERREGL